MHYDPKLSLILTTDASEYGIGLSFLTSVLMVEASYCLCLHNLTSNEQNYSLLDKEVLLTDHKPLTTILCPTRGVPPIAAASPTIC